MNANEDRRKYPLDEPLFLELLDGKWVAGMIKQLATRVAAVGVVLSMVFTSFAGERDVAWRRVPQAALQESQQTGRPLLIYVGAEFCGYCRKLERTTWADADVARIINAGFVPLEIDGQRDVDLARQLGVRGFPAVIILSPEQKVVGRVDGYREPTEMRSFLLRYGVFPASPGLAGR